MQEPLAPDRGPADVIDVTPLIDWLIERAIGTFDYGALLEQLCLRLTPAGLPLVRVNVALRLLHPLIRAKTFTWQRGRDGIRHQTYPHGHDPESWERSPYAALAAAKQRVLRLSTADARVLATYPLLADLVGIGVTEYMAFGMAFDPDSERGVLMSFATDHPGGFTRAHLTALERLSAQLTLVSKLHLEGLVARYVAETYLGRDAGTRVMNGQIQRGDGEAIHAAVLYSDLRESTRLAEALSPPDLLALLDDYFECTAGAVLAEGGEVLALIGDAVLAIFPAVPGSERAACEAAVAAARRAQVLHAQVQAARTAVGAHGFDFGIGLHVGDVLYGNIGVPERLSFTVIGPTTNEVARLESLTKSLGHRVLASDRFAAEVPLPWQHLGLHELRGARLPRAVYALPPA
jgi:adenylate cyclase